MKTVAELFERLEMQGLTYAVLRNYENLPDLRVSDQAANTDVDLVLASEELPRFREILVSLARDMEWDALTECKHFGHSGARHHNIEIFRFYRASPLDFLQIDIFHGYLNWGLPLMDEADLLAGRRYDERRGLTHVDPIKENIYRLAQLHGLQSSPRAVEKANRYRPKVLAVCASHGAEFFASIERYFGKAGLDAVKALESGHTGRFTRAMHKAKATYALRFAVRHPARTLRFVLQRVGDNRARFHSKQCGAVIKAHAASAEAREAFIEVMNAFAKLNAFDRWVERPVPARLYTRRERNVMEQGGLVIEWNNRSRASLVIERGECAESIKSKIIACAVGRHTVLHAIEHRPVLVQGAIL
jgi:hypothetical protein